MCLNLDLVRELINIGKLTLMSIEWLAKNGFCVVCADGQVESIEVDPA